MQLITLLAFLFFGCSKEPLHFKGTAHNHPYHVQIGHSLSKKEKKEIQRIIEETFLEIDTCYNHWNPNSDLSRGIQTEKVASILTLAHSFYELSEGWFNPKVGAPIKAFKQTGVLPTLTLPEAYDLDGMLKGFAIDLIAQRLLNKGYKNLYVEWGGDLRVEGKHPKGREWQVLLNNQPFPLKSASLATSGCKEQLWKIGNATYTHIIDPHTLEMIEVKNGHVHEVSVKAPSCALADALATACMACGSLEKAHVFAKKIKIEYPEVEFWITSYEL